MRIRSIEAGLARFAARLLAKSLPKGYLLEASALTDKGLHRKDNQDSVYLENPPPDHHDHARGLLAIVGDGMGGHAGGHLASRIAVESFAALARAADMASPLRKVIGLAMQTANAMVYERALSQPELSGMGTTLAAMIIRGRQCCFVNVGDSRIYHVSPPHIRQLSTDHTLVQALFRAGKMSAHIANHHPERHVLTRTVGTRSEVQPDIWLMKQAIRIGDRFLLCSDGLHDGVPAPRIADLLMQGTPRQAAQSLIQAAHEAGGHDNIAVVVIAVCPPTTMDAPGFAETRPLALPANGKFTDMTTDSTP